MVQNTLHRSDFYRAQSVGANTQHGSVSDPVLSVSAMGRDTARILIELRPWGRTLDTARSLIEYCLWLMGLHSSHLDRAQSVCANTQYGTVSDRVLSVLSVV